jgi:hypothetical protein
MVSEEGSSATASASQKTTQPEETTRPEETTQPEETTKADQTKDKLDKSKDNSPKQSLDSIAKEADKNAKSPITCQFTIDGLEAAIGQDQGTSISFFNVQSLYVEHLRVNSARENGVWFASVATAYGTTSQTVLWNYKIPDEVLAFARRDTVPCGVLEILGVVDDSMTPQWETKYDDSMESHTKFSREFQDTCLAERAEAKLDPAARQAASALRRQRQMNQRMNDSMYILLKNNTT